MGAVAAAILLVGCASDAPEDRDPASFDAGGAAAASEDAPASADHLDELYADRLHEGVSPAAPGTAYLEVAGERLEFPSLTCTVNDEPGRGQFLVSASDDTGHQLYLSREIGPDIGFDWENEHVQLALLTTPGDEETMAQYSNSMAQHARDEGAAPEWLEGAGDAPLVRVVGDEATATGTLGAVAFADEPLTGEFVAAATCP
ncbi:hypothetical protein FTX61_04145 [Nitriliruptoraceae bacterium ZYF776]|nr:hypothetical protein [Profundirhabdus halotolerans]